MKAEKLVLGSHGRPLANGNDSKVLVRLTELLLTLFALHLSCTDLKQFKVKRRNVCWHFCLIFTTGYELFKTVSLRPMGMYGELDTMLLIASMIKRAAMRGRRCHCYWS